MRKDNILFEWKENGKKKAKMINREEMYVYFINLVDEYPSNNEISMKMVKIIPKVESFYLDKDLNRDRDRPFLVYSIEGTQKTIEIIRHHKIIWKKINEEYAKYS